MSSPTIKELNEKLSKQPYMGGYTPSEEDAKLFKAIFGAHLNVTQWAARMSTYYPTERAQMAPKAVEQEDTYEDSISD